MELEQNRDHPSVLDGNKLLPMSSGSMDLFLEIVVMQLYGISDTPEEEVTPIMIQPQAINTLDPTDDEDMLGRVLDDSNNVTEELMTQAMKNTQELLTEVMKEIANEDITMGLFAKVVLNASNETMTRLFQAGGVGYERYVDTIKSFLSSVPLDERRQRYRRFCTHDAPNLRRKSQEHSAVQRLLKSPPINTVPMSVLTHFSSVGSKRRPRADEEMKQILPKNEPSQSVETDLVPRVRIRNRTFISDEAKHILNQNFEKDPYPNWNKRDLLGQLVGLSPEVIRIYFQNRRRILGTDKQISSDVQNKD